MPPSWFPLREAMQRYCEAYFTALNRWTKYESNALLENRIRLVNTLVDIYKEYSENSENYVFDLRFAVPSASLHPEVVPCAGRDAIIGGDFRAFEASRALVPMNLFQKAGVFFQSELLKAIAGWNEDALRQSNAKNRKNITVVLEKLFRIPEEAGNATITYAREDKLDSYMDLPISDLGEAGGNFYAFLIQYRETKDNSDLPAKKAKGRSSKADEPAWTTNHELVGAKLVQFFPDPKNRKGPKLPFEGEVVQYAPPTKPGAKDQMFHVIFEDGDEADLGEDELLEAIELYKKEDKADWTTDHPSVGKHVGAFFPSSEAIKKSKASKRKVNTIFLEGVVTKFSPKVGTAGPYYHICWSDGDENDLDEAEYQEGLHRFISYKNGYADGSKTVEEEWTSNHPSVGESVAAYFEAKEETANASASKKRKKTQTVMKLFVGKVIRYLPPTFKKGKSQEDQMYHILWSDGDEEDYMEADLVKGKALFANKKSEIGDFVAHSPVNPVTSPEK